MEPSDREAVVLSWCTKDRARAVLSADREIVDASSAVRALILDLVLDEGPEDELYDACAVLGRVIAQRAGSPTLASATLDHLCDALAARSAPWLVPARAALAEGFAGALVESVRQEDMRSWEFPACTVPLGEAAVAIAAGHPSDDDEVVAAWAARVAKGAAGKGIRRAVVSGAERPRAAVIDALALVGIEVRK